MHRLTLALPVAGVAAALAATAMPATGPSSSQSPYLVGVQPGVEFTSILTTGDGVGTSNYKMAGIPDGLGAFDNGDGTFTLLMNHELGSFSGAVRAHLSKGAFVSKWTIRKSDLSVISGEDLIKNVNTWNGSTWVSGTTAFNRFCSGDLAPVSAFYNSRSGKGFNGRLYLNGEEGGTERPFAHDVATGQSYDLSPWLGRISFENILANPNTGNTTVTVQGDDNGSSPGQQVYVHVGTKSPTGNPVERAGLTGGALYGIKVLESPQFEAQATWNVGDRRRVQFVDVSQFAAVPGTSADSTINTLEEDSQAKGVSNFQRPEDGSWDPKSPNDYYFVTTSSFGASAAENRTGQTRLWRLRFEDAKDPSQGATLKLLINGPVGTPDTPLDPTASAGAPGPQMFDNITVDNGQVLLLEDVGNQEYRGGVWVYDIESKQLVKLGQSDAARFSTGGSAFLTKDEESSGIIPAPFLGKNTYLLDLQAHYTNTDTSLVEGGQLMALKVPKLHFND